MDHQSNRNAHIGNICVQWSSLEYMLAHAIWVMIGVQEPVGKIVTANLDIKQRATMALALAHQTNAPIPFKRAIKETLSELREDLIQRRNDAVHGIHFTHPDPEIINIETHRGRGGRDKRPLTNKELEALGNKIAAARTRMFNALLEHARSQAKKFGVEDRFQELAAAILRNNSLTNEEGETNGPE